MNYAEYKSQRASSNRPFGRDLEIRQMFLDLTKTSPSHLSVVGPRYAGKSLVLRSLVDEIVRKNCVYHVVVFWDMSHEIPTSDESFFEKFRDELIKGLQLKEPDYAGHLRSSGGNVYPTVREVIDALSESGKKILMIWDGLDYPLQRGQFTRTLWDQLLDLCRLPGFKLVTATRKRLHSLIRDSKCETSDFWGVFERNVHIGTLGEDAVESIIRDIEGLKFDTGVLTELKNWTGFFPPFLFGFLDFFAEKQWNSLVRAQDVVSFADPVGESLAAHLQKVWDDCSENEKDAVAFLNSSNGCRASEIINSEALSLMAKGLIKQERNKFVPSCRILWKLIKSTSPDLDSAGRMFGDAQGYHQNIRSILERRVGHFRNLDESLRKYILLSIAHLPADPALALNNLTSIEDRSLELIMTKEFSCEMRISKALVEYWKGVFTGKEKFIGDLEKNDYALPRDRSGRLALLQLLTGSHEKLDGRARFVTKGTYVLVSSVRNFRNLGQHSDGEPVQLGVAVAALTSCVELFGRLTDELA